MRTFVPSVLLTATALIQIGLTRTADLTPWKGGGFGMFATLDHGAFRGVEIVVDAAERSEAMEIPPSLETAAARAAACPADWLLRDLADGVSARERRHRRPVSRITVRVWRVGIEPIVLRATKRPIRTLVYIVP
jgi:hypothetical protein